MSQEWTEVVVLLAPSGHWQYREDGKRLAWGRVRKGTEEQQQEAIKKQMEWQAQGGEPPRPWPYLGPTEDAFPTAVRVRRDTLAMLEESAIRG